MKIIITGMRIRVKSFIVLVSCKCICTEIKLDRYKGVLASTEKHSYTLTNSQTETNKPRIEQKQQKIKTSK